MLRMGKVVKDFAMQVPFELQPAFKYKSKTIRVIKYIADFVIEYTDGRTEVVDVKGFRTKDYLLKKKMLLYANQDMEFREV